MCFSASTALPAIAEAFDGLMVARGDLALQTPFEGVPIIQKSIISECASRGKFSIVATQLLHSMRESTRPTRAEVSDVATAVLDGADALMLSAETGFGRHPVRAVEVLRTIIERTERHQLQSGAVPAGRGIRVAVAPAVRE
jgi:pyruvate kinase